MDEVALCKVVLCTANPLLLVVVCGVGVGGAGNDGAVEFLVVEGRELVLLRSGEVVAMAAVVLMHCHCLDCVLAEGLAPVETLLDVVRPVAIVLLADDTLRGGILSEERVGGECVAVFAHEDVVDGGEGESERESDLDITDGVHHVTLLVVGVELVGRQRVRLAEVGTVLSVDGAVAIVVKVEARVGVIDEVAVLVADIDGINRGEVDECEGVARTHRVAVVAKLVAVPVCVVGVGAHLQPIGNLIVGLQAAGDTLVVGGHGDTVVVEVVEREVEVGAVGAASSGDGVLLTEAVVIDLVLPVVGSDQVVGSVVVDHAAEGGVGVQLAVMADEGLAVGHVIDVVAEAVLVAVGGSHDVLVGEAPRFLCIVAELVEGIVVECLVPHLIIFGRTVNHVVVGHGLGVRTPLGIDSDAGGVSLLATLGGDEDDAVAAAGTVEGGGGSVLQHGHRLDVNRVDVVQRT